MSQVPANPNDPRRRYTHQAYDVTYLGKAMETGPSGQQSRLSATYQASILTQSDAGVATPQLLGDVTQGAFITSVINHVALTSGTLVLTLPAYNGQPEIIITTQAVDLTIASVIFTGVNPLVYAPLTSDRPMTATVTGGTGGETALVSLQVTPVENGWF